MRWKQYKADVTGLNAEDSLLQLYLYRFLNRYVSALWWKHSYSLTIRFTIYYLMLFFGGFLLRAKIEIASTY